MNDNNKEWIVSARINESELFTRKFGTFAKSDYEVLMFTIFMDNWKGDVNDYIISKELGITESKVRSLKIKSQLLYPKDIDISKELEKAIERGYFDSNSMTYTITIEDPSVQRRVIYEIEKDFGNVQFTLNPKHLKLPIEYYLLLAFEICEKNRDEMLKEANRRWQEDQKTEQMITKESLRKRIWNHRDDLADATSFMMKAASVGFPLIQQMLMNIHI